MATQTASRLALDGGTPVRTDTLPYGRQSITDTDVEAVVRTLRSDWLTTGPAVDAFEEAFAQFVGTEHAVAVSNGTAALHCAMHAIGISEGDEVIVPTLTFAATANGAVFQGATPVFADVDAGTLLLDPDSVSERITPKTKLIAAVDYAGQPCDYDALRAVADAHGIPLLDDACHAVGGSYKGQSVGSLADVNTFSLHPVKHFTTGEGGLITTDDAEVARKMRVFRNHGITTDHRQRSEQGAWFYEMVELGYNYRLTDFQCALGQSQLERLPQFVEGRRAVAHRYDELFPQIDHVTPLAVREDVVHAYHLYVVRLDLDGPDGRPQPDLPGACAPKASASTSITCRCTTTHSTATRSAPARASAPSPRRRMTRS